MILTRRILGLISIGSFVLVPTLAFATTAHLYGSSDISVSVVGLDVGASGSVTANDATQAETVLTNSTDVHADADVSAYAKGVMRGDENAREVSMASDSVTLAYREPARFLWIFPASLTATAMVRADGTVTVRYPWYRFLMSSAPKEAEVKAEVESSVQGMASASGTFTASEQARVLENARAALAKVRSDAEASATLETNTQASGSVQ